jgi:glycosyltransferase involved in cell wall biosynthesis
MASVSIAMGTYNGAAYLPAQLQSLLDQSLAPVELVVGDDGSTDDTLEILREFSARAPFPVRVTINPKQLGYGENFLQTARRCTGDWVAFCDQDDVWLPSKLARCAEAIASGPADLGLIVHGAIVGDGDLKEIARMDWPKAGLYRRMSLPPDWLIQGFRQVIRRSLLSDIPFENRGIPWIFVPDAHDAWACLIAAVTGSVAVLDDCLAIYRRHDANTTEAVGLVPRSLGQRIKGKVGDNSAQYEQRADLFYKIADYLLDLASSQVTPERNRQFVSASKDVEALGDRFATRAQINAASSLSKRARAYARLARSGAYSTKQKGGFGAAEATIDLIRVALPEL